MLFVEAGVYGGGCVTHRTATVTDLVWVSISASQAVGDSTAQLAQRAVEKVDVLLDLVDAPRELEDAWLTARLAPAVLRRQSLKTEPTSQPGSEHVPILHSGAAERNGE